MRPITDDLEGLDSTTVTVSTRLSKGQRSRLKGKADSAKMELSRYFRELIVKNLNQESPNDTSDQLEAIVQGLHGVKNAIDLLRAKLERSSKVQDELRTDIVTALQMVLKLVPNLDQAKVEDAIHAAFPAES